MKQNVRACFTLLLCLPGILAMAQQPDEEWARRYNGTGSQDDYTTALAVDAAGNSYVAGTTNRSIDSQIASSIVLLKISPAGEKVWEKIFSEELTTRAAAVAIDNQGGVYVTGRIGFSTQEYDFITVRYDAITGEQNWVQYYNGDLGGEDEARAITTDNQGGVFVTGTTANVELISNVGDYTTIRYDAITGAQTWVSHYGGVPGGHDAPTAIVADNQGGVYVTGSSEGGENSDYNATIRYDAASGAETWVSRFSTSKGKARARSIAVDNSGGVYVTGSSSDDNSSDITTVRYNAANGIETWKNDYNSTGNSEEAPIAIAVDNNGGVYVTGHSGDWFQGFAIVTIRYEAATGSRTWARHYDQGSNMPAGIAADNQGGVYVTGFTFSNEQYDYITLRYDADLGSQSWVEIFDGGINNYDDANAIALDHQGGVYVTGISNGGRTHADIATIRYSAQSGTQSWVNRNDIIGNLADKAIAIVVDAAGNSYVSGTSSYSVDPEADPPRTNAHIVTVKYAPSGEELWVKVFDAGMNNRAAAIALDTNGGVYVTGSTDGTGGNYDYVTIRYDAETGEENWVSRYNGTGNGLDLATAITADQQGGVYVTGYSWGAGSSYDYATIRYNAVTGAQTWVQHYNGEANGIDRATGIAVDNQGGLYVTGFSDGQDTSNDYATLRYDATSGTQTWVQRLDGGSTYDIANAIAADNQGGVFVTGYAYDWRNLSQEYLTVRYAAATGQESWVRRYDGGGNGFGFANALAVDHAGGLYVTGSSSSTTNANSGYATIRYEAGTGQQSWVQHFNGPANGTGWASAIATGPQGDLYVTGYTLSDAGRVFSTVKYTAATGTQLWDVHTSGPDDAAGALALDPSGNVIVTGYSRQLATDHDFLTIKYSQQSPCPLLSEATIHGHSTATTGASGVVYTLRGVSAASYTWHITDHLGKAYTRFSGQGSTRIKVRWPSTPGFYQISAAYQSGNACTPQTAVTYVHVYDTGAGYVTGNGWFHSPANKDYELMTTKGKAHFSLQARYHKNGKQVEGQSQLRLENSSLLFRSTGHEARTLVIAGNQAFYRGQGRLAYRDHKGRLVEDKRRFGFLLAATDAQLGQEKGKGRNKYKGREKDRFRLLIWEISKDGSRGAIVYDNQPAGSQEENARVWQQIAGGDIIIHSPQLKGKKVHRLLAREEPAALQGLVAYPTAFQEHTTVAFTADRDGAYHLELYDMKGALVRRIASGNSQAGQRYEHELPAAGLSRGLYLVRLLNSDSMQTVKVIVQR